MVRIDETPTVSRGRRQNCAESIKNSIRNRVCSHTHAHHCIILRNYHPSSIVPADFPPSAAPRESRNYADPSPFTRPPAAPEATRGWSQFPLLISPYIYPRPPSIADRLSFSLSFYLSLACVRLLVIITTQSALTINSSVIDVNILIFVTVASIDEEKYFLYVSTKESKYFVSTK